MKQLFLASLLTLFVSYSFAKEPEQLQSTVTVKFWVNGNCEMCQARIQKAALSVKGVKMATWDIESKILTLIYNDKKCNLDDVKKSIAAVGHDSETHKAPNEVYEQLHSCCKYERQ